MFVGDYVDDNVYFNSPLLFLPNLNDPWYLEQYRQSQIIVCVGQGAWEEPMLADARALAGDPAQEEYPLLDRFLGLRCEPRLALVAEDVAIFFVENHPIKTEKTHGNNQTGEPVGLIHSSATIPCKNGTLY